jgi:seryl-tRNA synthetase
VIGTPGGCLGRRLGVWSETDDVHDFGPRRVAGRLPLRNVIDLRKMRDNQAYRDGAIRKGAVSSELDDLMALDEQHRVQLLTVERLRADANSASKDIGKSLPEERPAKIDAAGALKAELGEAEAALDLISKKLTDLALTIPNPADPSVPSGGEDDFEVIASVGDQRPAPPLDHAELGEALGLVDQPRGAATSGSRFAYLRGGAVQLEFALVQWVLDKLVAHGFEPIVPPVLVREDMMVDAGFFPTDRHQVYSTAEDNLFLVGTAEIPLAGLHRGERLESSALPARYAGFSTCFRREAGTYGKDTRGIFRVHQFDKVEMFSYTQPDDSWDELEHLLSIEREILDALELPYRVIAVADGDLGAAAAKKYDCEVWLPSEGQYRELTSCSNYLDYSARRLDCRVKADKAKGEKGSRFVHTLNGTAIPVARMLVFLFEHYQCDDGSLSVPDVLRPFCSLESISPQTDKA